MGISLPSRNFACMTISDVFLRPTVTPLGVVGSGGGDDCGIGDSRSCDCASASWLSSMGR